MELLRKLLIAILITSSYAYHVQTEFNRTLYKDSLIHNKKQQFDSNDLDKSLISNHPIDLSYDYSIDQYRNLFNPYTRSSFNNFNRFEGLLFSCDNLKAGFYADVYNDCKNFYLCYEAPDIKFNPLKQLAMTIYTCPQFTYFNMKKLACTPLINFEMSCHDQLNLFRPVNKKENNKFKFKDGKINDKLFEYNGKSIVNDNLIKNHPDVVSYLLSLNGKGKKDELISNDRLVNDQPYHNTTTSSISVEINSQESTKINNNNTESTLLNDEIIDIPDKKDDIPSIIETTFFCEKPGYYADLDHNCKIFHICVPEDVENKKSKFYQHTFACPNLTQFDQVTMTCVNKDDSLPCSRAPDYYHLNEKMSIDTKELLHDDEIATESPNYLSKD